MESVGQGGPRCRGETIRKWSSFHECYKKEFVLLKHAISLKVKYEKVNFQTVFFAIILVIINGHTCKLFEKSIDDVQNKGNGEINTV